MEKYFKVVKGSSFYKKYFEFLEKSNKLNDLFKEFSDKNNIETKYYYQNVNRLSIVPTEKDKETFKGMFLANSNTDFKKTSKICKEWVELCKENSVVTPREPSLLLDSDVELNSYCSSQRLFNIEELLIGSVDNKWEYDFELTGDFEEIKASEFYKIVEDSEYYQD